MSTDLESRFYCLIIFTKTLLNNLLDTTQMTYLPLRAQNIKSNYVGS